MLDLDSKGTVLSAGARTVPFILPDKKRTHCYIRGINCELGGIIVKTRGMLADFRGITQKSCGIPTQIGGISKIGHDMWKQQ